MHYMHGDCIAVGYMHRLTHITGVDGAAYNIALAQGIGAVGIAVTASNRQAVYHP